MTEATAAKLAAAALLSLGMAGCGYNAIPTDKQDAIAKWAEVENQYQRRADVIPNLVATVKGYATQEKDVLTSVTEARAKATSVNVSASDLSDPAKLEAFQKAQKGLGDSLGRLLAVKEAYPDLKSNRNFLALQSQVEGTESRIATARRDYIDAVQRYNTDLVTFPGSVWHSLFFKDEKPMATFTAKPDSEVAPTVRF